jgi:DNA-binding MarR family transcriptional regulator
MTQKTRPAFDLSTFLPYRIASVGALVSRDFAQHYRSQFGISIAEWRVLAHLSQDGALSVRDIHARVDLDKPKVSRAASRLEAAGLITKVADEQDRRLVALSLTDKGAELMQALIPVALEFQAELQQRLGATAEGFALGLAALTAPRK